MSFTALKWATALHIFGVVLWIGAMIGVALLLASPDARKDSPLIGVARKLARVMDVGALLAIICGIYILVRTKSLGTAWPLKQPWMHIKLTVVVLGVFGLHGLVEAKLARIRRGDSGPLKPMIAALVIAVALGIIILAKVEPFTKQ